MNKLIVGVAGPMRAGKETWCKAAITAAAELLPHLQTSWHQFRDPLVASLKAPQPWRAEPKEPSRTNLQREGQDWNTHLGEDALSQAVYELALRDPASIVFLDGARWPANLRMLQKAVKKEQAVIVYIDADFDIRYARAITANREGDGALTKEAFAKQHEEPNEKGIPAFFEHAAWIFQNNSDNSDDVCTNARLFAATILVSRFQI